LKSPGTTDGEPEFASFRFGRLRASRAQAPLLTVLATHALGNQFAPGRLSWIETSVNSLSDEKSQAQQLVSSGNMAKRKRGSEMAEMAEMERIFNGICKHHVNKRSDLSSSEAKVNATPMLCNCGSALACSQSSCLAY